jgi:hypothetical protein
MHSARAALLIAGFLIAGSTHAEQSGCLERTIPVSISSGDATSLPLLTVADLEGVYKKKPVSIKSVEINRRPPRIILLVDTSASMLTTERAAAGIGEAVLAKLPADAEVGLTLFADDPTPVTYPTKDRSRVTYALEALRTHRYYAKGRTAIWSAVRESIHMFGTPVVGDSFYLISDGGDNESKLPVRDLEQVLGNSGIRLFAVMLAQPIGIRSRTTEALSGPEILRDAVRSTGGTAISDQNSSGAVSEGSYLMKKDGKVTEFGKDVDRQLDQILKFYRVEMTLPEPVDKRQNWKLDLTGSIKSQAGKLELAYPTALLPCAAPTENVSTIPSEH